MWISFSSIKKRRSARQVSLSMDNVIAEEGSARQTRRQTGTGRPHTLDLKLTGPRAKSSDAMPSKSTVFSVCGLLPLSICHKVDNFVLSQFF